MKKIKTKQGGGNTIRVTIPLKNGARIEVEGEMSYVKNTIEGLGEIFDTLKTAIGEVTTIPEPITITSEGTDTTIPSIPKELKNDLREALVHLVESTWGRAQPRKLNEFMEALKVSAMYRSKGSVAGALNALTGQNRIRRLKENPKEDFTYAAMN